MIFKQRLKRQIGVFQAKGDEYDSLVFRGKGNEFWRLEARGGASYLGELKEVQDPGGLGGWSGRRYGWRETGSLCQEEP